MREILAGIAAVAMSFASAQAQDQLENYAALPRIWDAELSPDGSMLATGCSPRGTREICLYDLEDGGALSAIPAPDGGRITGFYWVNDTYLIYTISAFREIMTMNGQLEITVARAASFNVRTRETVLLLDDMPGAFVPGQIVSALVDDDEHVALEAMSGRWSDRPNASRLGSDARYETTVFKVSLEDGNRDEQIFETGQNAFVVLDAHGVPVLEVRIEDETGEFGIYRVVDGASQRLYSEVFEAEYPQIPGFTDNGEAVALDIPGVGIRRLEIATGELSDYDLSGTGLSEASLMVDTVSREVIGYSSQGALPEQRFLRSDFTALREELSGILTEAVVELRSWNQAKTKFVVIGWDVGRPPNYYLLDLQTGGLGLLDTAYALPDGGAGVRERLTYANREGQEIEAWLTRPAGVEGPLPLILLPHGGPRARDSGVFDWQAAYFSSLGYAVLQPNYRGSTGQGEAFIAAGIGEFGTGMIADMIDGARHVSANGLAEADYCAVGGSYGGYAALMLALEDPEHVRCAISFGGVTAPFAFIGTRDYSDTLVRYWERYIGSRFDDRAYRQAISPVDRAGEFSQPLLVMHGDEDTVVPPGQLRLLRRELDGRGDAEFIMLPGENHYLDTQTARTAFLRASRDFLAEHYPADR